MDDLGQARPELELETARNALQRHESSSIPRGCLNVDVPGIIRFLPMVRIIVRYADQRERLVTVFGELVLALNFTIFDQMWIVLDLIWDNVKHRQQNDTVGSLDLLRGVERVQEPSFWLKWDRFYK